MEKRLFNKIVSFFIYLRLCYDSFNNLLIVSRIAFIFKYREDLPELKVRMDNSLFFYTRNHVTDFHQMNYSIRLCGGKTTYILTIVMMAYVILQLCFSSTRSALFICTHLHLILSQVYKFIKVNFLFDKPILLALSHVGLSSKIYK